MQHQVLRTILIDDEPDARSVLRNLIQRFCPNLEICAEAGTVDDALAAIRQHKPTVIFLDIDLHEGSGFDILKAFPKPDFKVIFVTAHDDYAMEAFKLRALHYLLKPIDPDDLVQAIHELETQPSFWPEYGSLYRAIATNLNGRLMLPTVQGTTLIRSDEIVYACSDDKYATIVLDSGEKIFVSLSLIELEGHLPPIEFIRPHQSYIIRIDAVRKVRKSDGLTLMLKDKTEIPVSRRNKDMVLRVLGME